MAWPAPSALLDPFTHSGDRHLEQTLLRRISAISSVVTLGVIAPLTALAAQPVVALTTAMFGLVTLSVYAAARRNVFPFRLVYALALVMIAGIWFPASGSVGSALLYQGSMVVYAVVIFRGRTRIAAVAALVALTLCLLGIEFAHPTLVRPIASQQARFWLLGSGVISGTVLVTSIMSAVLSAYDRERDRLAESRATLAALVNSAPDMVWLVRPPAFAVTQFNAAFSEHCRQRLGVTAEVGAIPAALYGPEEGATWSGYYERALADGPFTVERQFEGGQTLLLSFSPVRHDGSVVGVSAFSHDITALRDQERQRGEMERQLLQAQKMEGLGRLAGGVAHDFNNMLTAILGYAEMLRASEVDPVKRANLDAIERAANRSAELTRKLLAFGRRGKNVVEPVSVQGVVRDCLVMLTPTLRPDVQVRLDLREHWTVDGDRSQITLVVLNLCLNANEAMPAGGDLVITTRDVTVASPDGSQDFIELQVRDDGVGIPEDVQNRIFEPFFSTKPGGTVSGTGLGLATVDGAVTVHGGTVAVDSRVGAGSTFTVRLPRGRLGDTVAAAATQTTGGAGIVLVVEDEPLVRSVITTALDVAGYRALLAQDGEEGVQLFAQHHATLAGVILDLRMPRLGGAEAFRAMQDIAPQVPIIVCSGYGDNEEVQHLMGAGARGLLVKPFTRADFAAALDLMRGRASSSSPV